jgi:hypothetical protein
MEQPQAMSKKPVSFQYVTPTEEQKALMQVFRDKFQSLAEEIEKSVPLFSRGKSLALTNLEQAAFWLNKGITLND